MKAKIFNLLNEYQAEKKRKGGYVSIRVYIPLFSRIFRKAVQLCSYNDRNSENHGNARVLY